MTTSTHRAPKLTIRNGSHRHDDTDGPLSSMHLLAGARRSCFRRQEVDASNRCHAAFRIQKNSFELRVVLYIRSISNATYFFSMSSARQTWKPSGMKYHAWQSK